MFHKLRIENRQIYLDGRKIDGVLDYELSDSPWDGAELRLHLKVEPPEVNTDGDRAPETIMPLDRLRELVREEIAAHEERQKVEPEVIAPTIKIDVETVKAVVEGINRMRKGKPFIFNV